MEAQGWLSDALASLRAGSIVLFDYRDAPAPTRHNAYGAAPTQHADPLSSPAIDGPPKSRANSLTDQYT